MICGLHEYVAACRAPTWLGQLNVPGKGRRGKVSNSIIGSRLFGVAKRALADGQ